MRVLASCWLFSAALLAQGGDREPAPSADVDFERDIAPLLVSRCIECHGPKKQKGDLRLDAREHLFPVDGEDAWSVVPGDVDASELLRRLALPADDDEVMPQKGEPLTPSEQALFVSWVRAGAEWPAEGDSWIAARLGAAELPRIRFDLPPIDEQASQGIAAAVSALRERGAVVQRVAEDTSAVEVNLSLLRDQVTDDWLVELAPLAPVLVWLDLSRTAVTTKGAKYLAVLRQLRRLSLANTAVDDPGFAHLSPLVELQELNAYGSGLGNPGLASVAALPKLRKVYAWQSRVTRAGVEALGERTQTLAVDLGDYVEARLAAAGQEIAARERRSQPVNDVCPVSGAKVDAAQVVEHDGRRIAFCCAKCKAKFEKDPAAFAAKVVVRDATPGDGDAAPPAKPEKP